MQTSIPQPPASPTWPEAISMATETDELLTALMSKVIDLERSLTDRRYRRHLRRTLTSSARSYAWAGGFAAGRWEALSAERPAQ